MVKYQRAIHGERTKFSEARLLASPAVFEDESKVEKHPEAHDEADGCIQDLPDVHVLHTQRLLSPVQSLQERQQRETDQPHACALRIGRDTFVAVQDCGELRALLPLRKSGSGTQWCVWETQTVPGRTGGVEPSNNPCLRMLRPTRAQHLQGKANHTLIHAAYHAWRHPT